MGLLGRGHGYGHRGLEPPSTEELGQPTLPARPGPALVRTEVAGGRRDVAVVGAVMAAPRLATDGGLGAMVLL
jgi:hypothetical protein